ncbi:MAG: gas vesicle protein K [Bacteroidota bacterium]
MSNAVSDAVSDAAPDPASRARAALDPVKPHRTASAQNVSAVPLSDGQRRVEVAEDNPGKGLAHLVLTLVKLLHDLLEKQAVGRMERGTLTDEEVERVGRTLMKQAEELERLCEVFGLELDDLHLDLGTIQHPESTPAP